ncbi:hypothetical protein [Cyclobacterium jeungdonense]|uniref:Uncharacterized protein n=1 Tax=Cyclobacterium jeungdonense TaxID=708087 RepID=A0ABT8CAJ1_9BACT|nr:hypothetical protein [Cyclobacterium jeungdonense]MDN3688696.1 hypothetical protein [Cyclobacterium jeungdonense]
MHQVHINKTTYPLPSRWDELTADQVIKTAWLSSQRLDRIKLAKLLFIVLTRSLPWHKRLRIQWFYFFQANTLERGDLVFLTRSFAEFTQFTAQKLEKIWGKSVLKPTFYGPTSAMANCTLWEYVKAEQYFTRYLKDRDEEWLNKLIAVLYRPRRRDYDPQVHEDPRVPLLDTTIPFRARQIARLPLPVRIAILMWFDGCRIQIIRMFPFIFKKDETKNTDLMQKLGAKEKSGNWLDLMTGLSANMTQFTEIANTNLTIALTDITFRIRQQKEAAKKSTTNKRR